MLLGGLGTATLGAGGVSLQFLSFEIVTANGVSGGLDTARFTGSGGNDTFTANPTSGSIVGAGYNISTTNFDRHFATGGGGAGDIADFTDSAGNDTFSGSGVIGTLSGTGFLQQATSGFETIRIRGTSGGTNTRSLTTPLLYTLQQFGTWV